MSRYDERMLLRRVTLFFVGLLDLVLLFALAAAYPVPRERLGAVARMRAVPVPLFPGDPARVRVGALTYLGGVRLESPDPAFGGFSAMHVASDGRITLLSDAGNVVSFRLDRAWQVVDPQFSDLGAGPGWERHKSRRDSESLAGDPATGRFWVGFEGRNAIFRFTDITLSKSSGYASPMVMRGWPTNGGAETLIHLQRGGFIAISETGFWQAGGARAAVRFADDPVDHPDRGFRFAYAPPKGYDPSDGVQLPDGRLLILNRRISPTEWFTAKLVLVDLRDIRRGATVAGREIATLDAPATRDNFEAVAVTREGGALILWMATDDNLQWPEQSLLFKFRLDVPPLQKR